MTRLSIAGLLLAPAVVLAAANAQTARTGVSHPETAVDVAEMTPAAAPAPAPAPAKPSPAAPASQDPTAHALPPVPDPDADVVTYVPSAPNELPIGTLLKVRMDETLSTKNTLSGTPFTATVEQAVERDGKVIIPAGAEMHGTVEEVHGGARFFGRSSLLLKPSSIVLPDGSHYVIHAQVIDTGQYRSSQVDAAGAVIGSDHAKSTLAVMSLTTGASAAAGAVFGGVPGALIGAGVGAGVSTVHWLRQDRETRLPVESKVTFSLTTAMPMTPLH